MTATLFFVTNIVVLYDTYNREPQKWFCVIIQISRISKSGVFKGGIPPSGLSPLALYADYPFIIRSYAIYKRQGKAPDGTSYFSVWHGTLSYLAKTGDLICGFFRDRRQFYVILCSFYRCRCIYTPCHDHVSSFSRSTVPWKDV